MYVAARAISAGAAVTITGRVLPPEQRSVAQPGAHGRAAVEGPELLLLCLGQRTTELAAGPCNRGVLIRTGRVGRVGRRCVPLGAFRAALGAPRLARRDQGLRRDPDSLKVGSEGLKLGHPGALVQGLLRSLRPGGANPFQTMFDVLSGGLHGDTDEECCALVDALAKSMLLIVAQLNEHIEARKEYEEAVKDIEGLRTRREERALDRLVAYFHKRFQERKSIQYETASRQPTPVESSSDMIV